jgi:hypothetical protein
MQSEHRIHGQRAEQFHLMATDFRERRGGSGMAQLALRQSPKMIWSATKPGLFADARLPFDSFCRGASSLRVMRFLQGTGSSTCE